MGRERENSISSLNTPGDSPAVNYSSRAGRVKEDRTEQSEVSAKMKRQIYRQKGAAFSIGMLS